MTQPDHGAEQCPTFEGPQGPCSVVSVCSGQHKRFPSGGCWSIKHAWGPNSLFLAVALVLVVLGTPTSAIRWFGHEKGADARAEPESLRKWQDLFESSNQKAFEDAYKSTYGKTTDVEQTLDQYDSIVHWLSSSSDEAYAQIHELHSYTTRELVYDAMQLASKTYNETAALTILDFISSRLSQLPAKYGYPVARRVIIGAILKLRVQNGPLSKAVQMKVDMILLQLYQLHKTSSANKGAVQFFHISKSGGTNLCQSAQSNGCQSEGFDERSNCLIKEFADTPRWVGHTAHKYIEYRLTGAADQPKNVLKPWFVNFHSDRRSPEGCAGRLAFLKSRGWNFYANEFTLPLGETSICKEFVNLMMWRHPIDRLRSQISWIQKLYKGIYGTPSITQAFKSRTSGFWERLLPAAVNNYFIRSLLGHRFFEYPVVAVNATHAQRARVQVMMHDILLTLEHKAFNDVSLKMGLGWGVSLADSNIRSSSDMADEISMPQDFEVLEERNALDVSVYEFAREMQALDVMLWSFMQGIEAKLGIQHQSSGQCGLVSLNGGTPSSDSNSDLDSKSDSESEDSTSSE